MRTRSACSTLIDSPNRVRKTGLVNSSGGTAFPVYGYAVIRPLTFIVL